VKSLISGFVGAFACVALAQTLQGTTTFKSTDVPVTGSTELVLPYANGFYAVSRLGDDMLIQRYNVNGIVVASGIYDNPHGGSDYPITAGMDTAGNLYLASYSESNQGDTTWYTKFNASITLQWERSLPEFFAGKLLVTPGGLGIIVGETNTSNQFRRVAHGANGNLIYDQITPGRFFDSVLGLDNSVWVVGRSTTNLPRVWRYNGVSGAIMDSWTDSFGYSGARFSAAAIDPNGTFYAAGITTDDGTSATAKVSILRFTNVFTRFKPISQPFDPDAIRIDANNLYLECAKGSVPLVNDRTYSIPKSNPNSVNSFMEGINSNSFRGTEIDTTRVYTLVGNTVRVTNKTFGAIQTTGNLLNSTNGMTRGTEAGHVLIFGSAVNQKGKIQRVNQDGALGYSADITDNGRANMTPGGAVTDGNGELFVAYSRSGTSDTKLSRVNRSGTVVWTADISGLYPRAVAVDQNGVYVVGTTMVGILNQPTIRRFAKSNGASSWSKTLTFNASTSGSATAVLALEGGTVVVAGTAGSTPTYWKLNGTTGDSVWALQTGGFNELTQMFALNGNDILTARGNRIERVSEGGTLVWFTTISGTARLAYQLGMNTFWASGNSNGFSNLGQYSLADGSVQNIVTYVGTQSNRVPVVNANGSRVALMYEPLTGSTRIEQTAPTGSYTANLPGEGVAASFGPNGEMIVFGEQSFTDGNGGSTKKLVMRRFGPTMTLEETRVIEPSGVGLDGYAAALVPGTLGQYFTIGVLERRNEGNTLLATRWRHELAPVAAADTYTVKKGQTLMVFGSGVLTNDSDGNGDALTASLVTSPQAGTLTLNPNGTLSYVAPATAGARTFIYRAVDSTNRVSNNAVVTLNVIN
jgi:hypothetical protein